MLKARRRTIEEVLKRLPAEELENILPLKDEDVDNALRKGREERLRAEEVIGNSGAIPDRRFS